MTFVSLIVYTESHKKYLFSSGETNKYVICYYYFIFSCSGHQYSFQKERKITFSVKILSIHYCHWHLQSGKLRSKSTALESSLFTSPLCLGSSFFCHHPSIHLFPFPCPQAYLQIHVVWICFVCKTSLTIETFLSSPVLPSPWCHLYTHTPHSSPVLKEALCLVWLKQLITNLTWLSSKHIASALAQSKAR